MSPKPKTPGASKFAKDLWRKLNEASSLKEGENWTVGHEENFAKSGIRYLAEGKAPMPGLRGVFERLKNWLLDLYVRLDNAGVAISPSMRQLFDKMFTVSYDMSDSQLRYALAESINVNTGIPFADPTQTDGQFLPEDQAALNAEKQGDLTLANDLAEEARPRADEDAARIARENPDLEREFYVKERQELDDVASTENRLPARDVLRSQALECRMSGGQAMGKCLDDLRQNYGRVFNDNKNRMQVMEIVTHEKNILKSLSYLNTLKDYKSLNTPSLFDDRS